MYQVNVPKPQVCPTCGKCPTCGSVTPIKPQPWRNPLYGGAGISSPAVSPNQCGTLSRNNT